MIEFKRGVEWFHRAKSGLMLVPSPACAHIVDTAEGIWETYGVDLVVTAIFNGRHTRLSEHWQGNAVDLRTRNLPGGYLGEAARFCARELKRQLGPEYTVILEADHIHAHHEPGGGKLVIDEGVNA